MKWTDYLRQIFADDESENENTEDMIYPFQVSRHSYQYYDMGKIAGELRVSKKKLEEAKRLAEEGHVVLDKVEFSEFSSMSEDVKCGIARGYYLQNQIKHQIILVFSREYITKANCYMPGCGGRYENAYNYATKYVCTHLLAMMLLVDKYLKKHNPGDSTDSDAERLLRGFRSQHVRSTIEEYTTIENDLQFLPVIERGREGISVSFKAGVERLYVVKNLPEFVACYEKQNTMLLGTKTEIDFAKHRMSESAKETYEYVKQIVRSEENRICHNLKANAQWYEGFENIRNHIDLYGDRLDQFFELYIGKELDCTDKSSGKSEKKKVILKERTPSIILKITKNVDSDMIFHGIRVQGMVPQLIDGNKYSYFFLDNSFCRIGEEMVKDIGPLLELESDGEIDFSVGRKHLSEFYHQVLPVLKENSEVIEEDADIINYYVPPKPVFQFYLDAEEGRIVCKPRVKYGEMDVSLLDSLRENHEYDAFRNYAMEEDVLFFVQKLFTELNLEQDEVCTADSDDAVLYLMEEGVEKLIALGEVHTTERFRKLNVRKKVKMKLGVSVKSDIMNLSVASDELEPEELLEILKNYQRKKKYYRLKNGDFVNVNDADMDMLVQMMETLQVSPKEFVKGNMNVPAYRALYLNKMLEQGEDVYLNRDKNFKNMIKEFKTVDESEFEVPESLAGIMRGYQVKGFRWMKTLDQYGFGGILADDMGLGKTLQTISVLLSSKEDGDGGTSLIICPASLVYNWGEEFAKFAPAMKVALVVGNQKERADIIKNYKNADVLVTSYDLLRRDIAEYEDCSFRYQILDEAQYIKNHTTAVAKTVKLIKSKQRYALTGTPIENRLSELWSIFDYLMPGFLYRYETFRKEMERKIVKQKDEEASERLKKMVSPFILRRLKQDVLKDLPEKIEKIRYAKLEAEQQRLYDGQVVHMQNVLASTAFETNKIAILAELTKIRQICCDPELLFEKYTGGSAKRIACMELIQSAMEGEHKILVFSQFTSMLELLAQDLKEKEVSYYTITGETPKAERVELVKAFNNDDTPVFLISLKAGGTGLNLTGADVVIHYDPWWNQAAQNQATDRAHRIGQNKVVSVYKLIAKGTIEEKIMKMQEEKKNLADSILSGDTGGITQMSKEELLELLGK